MRKPNDEDQFMQHYRNYMAPECRAQLPAFNRVGRGLRGDAFVVSLDNVDGQAILTGHYVDAYTGEHDQVWEANLSELTPVVGYKLYQGIRSNVFGWWIHFRCKNMVTGKILWEFDTPFVKIEDREGPDSEEQVQSSY